MRRQNKSKTVFYLFLSILGHRISLDTQYFVNKRSIYRFTLHNQQHISILVKLNKNVTRKVTIQINKDSQTLHVRLLAVDIHVEV